VTATALSRLWRETWDHAELNILSENLVDDLFAKVIYINIVLANQLTKSIYESSWVKILMIPYPRKNSFLGQRIGSVRIETLLTWRLCRVY